MLPDGPLLGFDSGPDCCPPVWRTPPLVSISSFPPCVRHVVSPVSWRVAPRAAAWKRSPNGCCMCFALLLEHCCDSFEPTNKKRGSKRPAVFQTDKIVFVISKSMSVLPVMVCPHPPARHVLCRGETLVCDLPAKCLRRRAGATYGLGAGCQVCIRGDFAFQPDSVSFSEGRPLAISVMAFSGRLPVERDFWSLWSEAEKLAALSVGGCAHCRAASCSARVSAELIIQDHQCFVVLKLGCHGDQNVHPSSRDEKHPGEMRVVLL